MVEGRRRRDVEKRRDTVVVSLNQRREPREKDIEG